MKKLNLKRVATLLTLALLAGFAGCNTEDVNFQRAELDVTPGTLNFDYYGNPVDGNTFEIMTNRKWKVTFEDPNVQKEGWIAIDKTEGEGNDKVTVKLLPNNQELRSTRLRIDASINRAYVTITQTSSVASSVIYSINFGTGAQSTTPYEYLDEWIAAGKSLGEFGEGITNDLSLTGTAVSLRQSGRLSAGYEGASGNNKLFFGADGVFTINNIATRGASSFKVTFGVAHFKDNVNNFTYDKLTVEASANGTDWLPVNYTASVEPVSGSTAPDWYYCSGYFDLATGNSLYIRFSSYDPSSTSLDDVIVTAFTGTETPGTTVFTTAATSINETGATVGGSYTTEDGATPSSLGIEYKYGSTPYTRVEYNGTPVSPFTIQLTNLANNVAYTYRAFVTVNGKTTYGNEMTFTTTGGGGGGNDVIYNIDFGTGAATASPYEFLDDWITAGKSLGESGEGSSTVTLGGTAVSLRQSGRLSAGYEGASGNNKLFFGSNATFLINNITTGGASSFKVTFGVAHYKNNVNDFTYDKLPVEASADGTNWIPVTYTASVEPVAGSNAPDWYYCTGNFDLATTNSLYLRFTSTDASSTSLDDVTVTATTGGTPTFSFGQATLSGSLTVGTTISGAKITVPYYNASGQNYSGVNVAVSGAGADGISVTQQSTVTLGSGNGTVEFEVSGTPTTAGDVTFTISGITELTSPQNTVNGTVTGGGTGGEFFFEDFGHVDAVLSPQPKVGAYTGYTMGAPIVYSDPYATTDDQWADIRTTNGMLGTYNMHLWLPANREAGLLISGIESGYTNMTLSWETAANTSNAVDANYIVLKCNGSAVTVPSVPMSGQNVWVEVSMPIPDNTTTIEFYGNPTLNTYGFRVDNIRISGTK